MNVILRDLNQTRVHFEAAIHRVGEQAATRAFNRALNSEGIFRDFLKLKHAIPLNRPGFAGDL